MLLRISFQFQLHIQYTHFRGILQNVNNIVRSKKFFQGQFVVKRVVVLGVALWFGLLCLLWVKYANLRLRLNVQLLKHKLVVQEASVQLVGSQVVLAHHEDLCRFCPRGLRLGRVDLQHGKPCESGQPRLRENQRQWLLSIYNLRSGKRWS